MKRILPAPQRRERATRRTVKLPADVYDAFELAAEALGGMGVHKAGGSWVVDIWLLAIAMCADSTHFEYVMLALMSAFRLKSPWDGNSLRAFRARQHRAFTDAEHESGTHVSWREYCQRLGIERADIAFDWYEVLSGERAKRRGGRVVA